jgi:PAS domain S-box-containing protein
MRDYQDQEATGGTGSQDGDGGHVLHVDPDERARVRLAAHLSESDVDATLTGVGSGDVALDRLTGQEFDCVVVDLDRPAEQWDEFVEAVPGDVTLILYTACDPTELPARVMRQTDSLVQKGNGESGRQLLVEKIRNGLDGKERSDPNTELVVADASEELGVFLLDDGGQVRWASQSVEAFFPAEDGMPDTDDFYARLAGLLADSPEAAKAVVGIQETDETRQEALSIPGPDGEPRPYLHESHPLPDDHSQDRVEIFEDLTRERDRQERVDLLETLVMGSQDGLYTLDANGVIDFCNPAMAETLGYDREELLGMHASEVMAEGELKDGQDCIKKVVNDPETESTVCDMTFLTKGGETREVSLHVTRRPSPDGSYTGLIGVMRNITERKERERELERFKTIIQAVGDGVYATNEQGEFIYVNEALEKATGYRASELVGEDTSILLDEADRKKVGRLVDELVDSEESTATIEVDVVTASGDRFPAEIHAALLPDDGGYRGMAGIARDITERKRQEEQLKEFTSIVAHDLRNPLSVGRGNLDLYRETGDEERLDAVGEAFEDMEQLIDDLLELAKVGEVIGDTTAVDLRDAGRQAWNHIQTEEATLVAGNELGEIQADRDRLVEALENLFRNAVEHGEPPITVRIGTTPDGFFVGDDGPGIPANRRDKIFDRGYTTADEGTGFGLAIVGRIVEAHGWSIDVTESADGGARFEVSGVEFA